MLSIKLTTHRQRRQQQSLLAEEVVDTILSGLCGVVLDLTESYVVNEQGVHSLGRVGVVVTDHIKVVVLGESHQVASPFRLLWA
jgi:hypothetical protein